MRRAILNSHTPNSWYHKGFNRMQRSYEPFKAEVGADLIFYPADLRAHRTTPYIFKPLAIHWAISNGYESILWMDSSNWFNKSPLPIFEMIESDGHYLQQNGWTTGEWCADSALAPLKVTREEVMQMPHLMANAMGFNIKNENTLQFLKEWTDVAPAAFPGPWNNEGNVASADPRVKGHRHDQTAASVISIRLDMKWTLPAGYISYAKDSVGDADAIIWTQGM